MKQSNSTLHECQICNQILPKSEFYKKKDINNIYDLTILYCKTCKLEKGKMTRFNNPEHYREYIKEYPNKYYHEKKHKFQIIQQKFYYNKLPYDKQIKYIQKLEEKYPELAELICN